MATSEGERAFEMMFRARRLTAGEVDSRARVRVDSLASWRMSVNLSGWSSLVMKDAGTAGSFGVVRRTCVSGSKRRGMSAFVDVAVVTLVL